MPGPTELLHPLTSGRFFAGVKHNGREGGGGQRARAKERRTTRFSIYGLSDATRFPFSSADGILQPAKNVKRKFKSFKINSAPRDCAAFTRLEYLASEDILKPLSKHSHPSTSILRRLAPGKRDSKGNIPILQPRLIPRDADVSFFLLLNVSSCIMQHLAREAYAPSERCHNYATDGIRKSSSNSSELSIDKRNYTLRK